MMKRIYPTEYVCSSVPGTSDTDGLKMDIVVHCPIPNSQGHRTKGKIHCSFLFVDIVYGCGVLHLNLDDLVSKKICKKVSGPGLLH